MEPATPGRTSSFRRRLSSIPSIFTLRRKDSTTPTTSEPVSRAPSQLSLVPPSTIARSPSPELPTSSTSSPRTPLALGYPPPSPATVSSVTGIENGVPRSPAVATTPRDIAPKVPDDVPTWIPGPDGARYCTGITALDDVINVPNFPRDSRDAKILLEIVHGLRAEFEARVDQACRARHTAELQVQFWAAEEAAHREWEALSGHVAGVFRRMREVGLSGGCMAQDDVDGESNAEATSFVSSSSASSNTLPEAPHVE